MLRDRLSYLLGAVYSLWAYIFRQHRQCLCARQIFLYLCHCLLCSNFVSLGINDHYRPWVPESEPSAHLSAHALSDGGDCDSNCTAWSACNLAVCHIVVGTVFYLLQWDVEPAWCTHRAFKPEQLSEPHGRDEPQRRAADRFWCGQFQAGKRLLRPSAGRCLPCRDRSLPQKSVCLLRVLLPHRRRWVLRTAEKHR